MSCSTTIRAMNICHLHFFTPIVSRCSMRFCFSRICRRATSPWQLHERKEDFVTSFFSKPCCVNGNMDPLIFRNPPTWFIKVCLYGGMCFLWYTDTKSSPHCLARDWNSEIHWLVISVANFEAIVLRSLSHKCWISQIFEGILGSNILNMYVSK